MAVSIPLTRDLRRIMGYYWDDFVNDDRILREAQLHRVTYMLRKRQLWLFGHVVRFLESDPVCWVIYERICPAFRGSIGRPLELATRAHIWHCSGRDPQA